jgi:hypothetical protein
VCNLESSVFSEFVCQFDDLIVLYYLFLTEIGLLIIKGLHREK